MIMDYTKIESILNYSFKDKQLLTTALVHRSFTNEHREVDIENNERLEFLGDAVLEIVVSEYLYRTCEKNEGDLSKMRAAIVCEKALSSWCLDNNLGKYIKLGHGEDISGGRKRPSVLSDLLEALFGAVYLDGGLEEARKVIHNVIESILNKKEYFIDNKTCLQEIVQERDNINLKYELIDEKGPDHDKTYVVAVKLNGKEYGIGTGRSKKAAQQEAAYNTLQVINSIESIDDFWNGISNDIKAGRD